jgi:hypothetical protein
MDRPRPCTGIPASDYIGYGKENDLVVLFPSNRFTLLRTGPSHIHTVHTLPTGEVVNVPAFYASLRRLQN